MELEQILALIDRVSGSKLTSFQFEEGNLKLSMEREITRPAPAAVPVAGDEGILPGAEENEALPQQGQKEEMEGNLVKSLLVGTFYAAPSEEAEPFVKEGDSVKKGQVLGIVEAMKLMNEIESDFDGEVAEILVKNGETVEYGQPLFRIRQSR